jgi:hypothetical protein
MAQPSCTDLDRPLRSNRARRAKNDTGASLDLFQVKICAALGQTVIIIAARRKRKSDVSGNPFRMANRRAQSRSLRPYNGSIGRMSSGSLRIR